MLRRSTFLSVVGTIFCALAAHGCSDEPTPPVADMSPGVEDMAPVDMGMDMAPPDMAPQGDMAPDAGEEMGVDVDQVIEAKSDAMAWHLCELAPVCTMFRTSQQRVMGTERFASSAACLDVLEGRREAGLTTLGNYPRSFANRTSPSTGAAPVFVVREDLEAGLRSGRIGVDQQALADCLTAVDAPPEVSPQTCGERLQQGSFLCSGLLEGRVPPHQPCLTDAECDGGLCFLEGEGTCWGRCVPIDQVSTLPQCYRMRASDPAACTLGPDEVCGPQTTCDPGQGVLCTGEAGSAPTCQPFGTLTEGEACPDYVGCAEGLFCRRPAAGAMEPPRCQPTIASGALCDSGDVCTSPDEVCAPTGGEMGMSRCTARESRGEGGACDGRSAGVCQAELFCHEGACTAPPTPAAFAPCPFVSARSPFDPSPCGRSAFCAEISQLQLSNWQRLYPQGDLASKVGQHICLPYLPADVCTPATCGDDAWCAEISSGPDLFDASLCQPLAAVSEPCQVDAACLSGRCGDDDQCAAPRSRAQICRDLGVDPALPGSGAMP